MKFWDTSALVPLLVQEPSTRAMRRLYRASGTVLTWWGTPTECASAIARLERSNGLSSTEANEAFRLLSRFSDGWQEVLPTAAIRDVALRLLRTHPLRAADALQLAAALMASEQLPSSLEFVSLDERLRAAASREGMRVMGR